MKKTQSCQTPKKKQKEKLKMRHLWGKKIKNRIEKSKEDVYVWVTQVLHRSRSQKM